MVAKPCLLQVEIFGPSLMPLSKSCCFKGIYLSFQYIFPSIYNMETQNLTECTFTPKPRKKLEILQKNENKKNKEKQKNRPQQCTS